MRSSGTGGAGLDSAVNKFYINIGSINVNNGNINNGISHSIAAEHTGDIRIYSQSIDNRVINNSNYVVNLDQRKVEFISPYIDSSSCRGYLKNKESPYLLSAGQSGSHLLGQSSEYRSTITHGLLKPARPVTQFISDAEDVRDTVIETFHALTGKSFPDNLTISICSEDEMKKAHRANSGTWHPGILGFAVNRHPFPSSIFVMKGSLDEVMLTLGHEIGHVLTKRLENPVDEEAKAFAFELAWAKTIIENDIGCLARNFNVDFRPADNGIHDRAFNFVQDMITKGRLAMDLFWDIAHRIVKTKT